jgi:hypothetical protein
VDPLSGYNPVMEVEHYIDGQHNGGVYNSFNHNTYGYCYQSPVLLIDPNGKQNEAPFLSAKARTALFGLKYPMVAYSIGEYNYGANNISTIASRFGSMGYGKGIMGVNSLGQDEGSERGAFRHIIWQAMVTVAYGADIAKQAGDAHENNPNTDLRIRYYNNIAEADQTVDLLNNVIGRSIGEKFKILNSKDLASDVLEEFYNNGLWQVRKNNNGKWEVFKGKLSNDKYNAYKKRLENLNGLARDSNEQKSRDKRTHNPSN